MSAFRGSSRSNQPRNGWLTWYPISRCISKGYSRTLSSGTARYWFSSYIAQAHVSLQFDCESPKSDRITYLTKISSGHKAAVYQPFLVLGFVGASPVITAAQHHERITGVQLSIDSLVLIWGSLGSPEMTPRNKTSGTVLPGSLLTRYKNPIPVSRPDSYLSAEMAGSWL